MEIAEEDQLRNRGEMKCLSQCSQGSFTPDDAGRGKDDVPLFLGVKKNPASGDFEILGSLQFGKTLLDFGPGSDVITLRTQDSLPWNRLLKIVENTDDSAFEIPEQPDKGFFCRLDFCKAFRLVKSRDLLEDGGDDLLVG